MSDLRIFTHPIRIYFEDTDFSGIVYHAAYLKFFERGRTEALRAVGVTHNDLLALPEPLALAVRKMTMEWIAPAKIDDQLVVQTKLLEIKGARMILSQEIVRDEALLARADVEAICLTKDGRPRRPPALIADRFHLSRR